MVQLVTLETSEVGTRVRILVLSHGLGLFFKVHAQQVENDLTGPHAFGPKKIYVGHKILMKQPHDCSY